MTGISFQWKQWNKQLFLRFRLVIKEITCRFPVKAADRTLRQKILSSLTLLIHLTFWSPSFISSDLEGVKILPYAPWWCIDQGLRRSNCYGTEITAETLWVSILNMLVVVKRSEKAHPLYLVGTFLSLLHFECTYNCLQTTNHIDQSISYK